MPKNIRSFKHPDESLKIKTKPAAGRSVQKSTNIMKGELQIFAKSPNTKRKEKVKMVTKKYKVFYVEVAEQKKNEKGEKYVDILGELKFVGRPSKSDINEKINERWGKGVGYIKSIKEVEETRCMGNAEFYEASRLLY